MAREYDAEEKIAYVEEYENSGMSIAEFAREKRLPASTLRSWLTKYLGTGPKSFCNYYCISVNYVFKIH